MLTMSHLGPPARELTEPTVRQFPAEESFSVGERGPVGGALGPLSFLMLSPGPGRLAGSWEGGWEGFTEPTEPRLNAKLRHSVCKGLAECGSN